MWTHVSAMDAGATADAFTLFERLEMQLEQHPGEINLRPEPS